jgi:dimethylargininase
MSMSPSQAIVRPPEHSYSDALTRRSPAPPVALSLAREQHTAYVAVLRDCGLDVITLPPDEEHPDAVFVQDPVIVIGSQAIVARPAMPSRQGESEALLAILRQRKSIAELEPPATLDGGDVLVADARVFVGLSTRTNLAACEQLSRLAGSPVEGIPLPDGLLHLLSGCTYLGANRMLVVESLVAAFPGFECFVVPEQEAYAANVLVVGTHAIVPGGHPHTAALVEGWGFTVHTVPLSEFEKRDGGVTCLSLLF